MLEFLRHHFAVQIQNAELLTLQLNNYCFGLAVQCCVISAAVLSKTDLLVDNFEPHAM